MLATLYVTLRSFRGEPIMLSIFRGWLIHGILVSSEPAALPVPDNFESMLIY
jgi:hypothetical protein